VFTRIRGIYDALTSTLEAGWLPLAVGMGTVVLLTRVF
jgi:hypothetical protein